MPKTPRQTGHYRLDNIRVVCIPEFICTSPTGEMTLPRAAELIELIKDVCKTETPPLPALLDCRGVSKHISLGEAHTIAERLHEYGCYSQRLALVYEMTEYDRVELINLWATSMHLNVRAFHDFEEAVHWLGQHEQSEAARPL